MLRKDFAAPKRHFYWEFHERGFQQAARWKDWKVIRSGVGKRLELYDLKSDPGEKKNVAAAKSPIRMETRPP